MWPSVSHNKYCVCMTGVGYGNGLLWWWHMDIKCCQFQSLPVWTSAITSNVLLCNCSWWCFCANCNILVACEILLCNILLLLCVLVAYGEYCVYYVVTVPDTWISPWVIIEETAKGIIRSVCVHAHVCVHVRVHMCMCVYVCISVYASICSSSILSL